MLLFWFFVAATAVQLSFWTGLFARLAFFRMPPPPAAAEPPPVSVIICARNEADNLSKNLHHFLNQNYRSFEIIVVNDYSTDQTRQVVLDFSAKYPNLRLIENQNVSSGKKAALATGIAAAQFDWIALSDADCCPATPHWIATMQQALHDDVQIALGYSPYVRQKGILNAFIRFETAYTALQYLSFALAGLPYMGVGRNLVYHKALYYRAGGFRKHAHIASGDDDLFVNAIASKSNTTIVLNTNAFVYSQPKERWKSYYYQKARHLTTATHYRRVHRWMLGALAASHAGHYAAGVLLLVMGHMPFTVLFTCLVRMVVVIWIYHRVLPRLQATDLVKWAPLLDICYVFFYFVFAPALLIGRKNQWK
ncbi:MAG TPA: glycosyltransferase [Saprospiraceae bacterium]|nr:glycosyltransferase [Saprospiraceae bacterium]HMP23569.1 glycosyltransferase [Saprospiraceae bacterium]